MISLLLPGLKLAEDKIAKLKIKEILPGNKLLMPYRVDGPIRNSPEAKCHLWFLKLKVSSGPKPPLPS